MWTKQSVFDTLWHHSSVFCFVNYWCTVKFVLLGQDGSDLTLWPFLTAERWAAAVQYLGTRFRSSSVWLVEGTGWMLTYDPQLVLWPFFWFQLPAAAAPPKDNQVTEHAQTVLFWNLGRPFTANQCGLCLFQRPRLFFFQQLTNFYKPPPPLSPFLILLSNLAGIRPFSVWRGWLVELQTVAAAHQTRQSQGPALLLGEREIHQSLPLPLQGLAQIGLMSERKEGVGWSVCGERTCAHHTQSVDKRLFKTRRRRRRRGHLGTSQGVSDIPKNTVAAILDGLSTFFLKFCLFFSPERLRIDGPLFILLQLLFFFLKKRANVDNLLYKEGFLWGQMSKYALWLSTVYLPNHVH